MKRRLVSALALFAGACLLVSCSTAETTDAPLRVALSPYQDIAMMVNIKNLGLEKKDGTKVEFTTLPWEDIPNALVSAGQTIDVGPVALTDYLSKVENMNGQNKDPIILIYPMHLFRGGGFISFNPDVPELTPENIKDKALVKKFLSYHIGVQKTSCFQMLIAKVARDAGVPLSELHESETTVNDGLLACQAGSLDMTACGLTQREEALKRHGRVVLKLDTIGMGELNFFACKESTYKRRKKDIDNLVRMWFDCTQYVLSDPDNHTEATLAYLRKNASTQYSLAEYKRAVGDEYFVTSLADAQRDFVAGDGKYSLDRQANIVLDYLHEIGNAKTIKTAPKLAFDGS